MRLLAYRLHRCRVNALAHFRVAVEDLESSAFEHADLDVTTLSRTVSEPGALDTATDAFVLRALVNVLDGIECFANAANALAHDLAGPELVTGIQNISFADVPPVDADLLGEHVHHAFHRELRLITPEPS